MRPGTRPLRLRPVATLILTPTAPFHFDGTVFNPSHFPARSEHWEPGRYWQTFRWRGRTYGLLLRDVGAVRRPRIQVTLFGRQRPPAAMLREIAAELRWRLDLDSTGVPAFVRRFRRDRYVGPAIRHRPGMRATSACSLYEFLVITVMLQNTVVRRSVSMLQALFERYGRRVHFDGQELWAFWDPQDIHRAPEEDLRALKVGYRARILKRQAEPFVRGEVDELALRRIADWQVLVKKLDAIYGVGPQSAWYMLFEFFHSYDVLEHISPSAARTLQTGETWKGKIVGRLLFGREVAPRRLRRFFANRYRPFRDLAFHYLMTDLFWQHRARPIAWLAKLIRL